MGFMEVVKSRYSCKKYAAAQITKEQLETILEAGRLAPTAKNNQEQHIYVVQSEEGKAKIDSLTPALRMHPLSLRTCCWRPRALALTAAGLTFLIRIK